MSSVSEVRPAELLQQLLEDDRYPLECVLLDGGTALLCPLLRSDEPALVEFFQSQVSDRDAETLKDDVRNVDWARSWVRDLDYQCCFPAVAFDEAGDRIIGISVLDFFTGAQRHVGEIRVVVGADYRKMGLGTIIIKELIRIAGHFNLSMLKAEIPSRNQSALKAFRQLGFEIKCSLDDYFLTKKGIPVDVNLMVKRIGIIREEDLFFEF